MSRVLGDNLEFNFNQALDMLFQKLTVDPAGQAGQSYFNTTSHLWKYHSGTSWIDPLARANHSGTQLSNTISDLSGNSLSFFAAPTADVPWNAKRITGLANGVNANDAVNKSQLDTAFQAMDYKPTADAATLTNVAGVYANGASGVGATFTVTATGVFAADGYNVNAGDRVFFNNQTAVLQNGLYLCTTQGAAGVQAVFTRDTTLDTSAKFKGAIILVGETSATLNGAIYLSNVPAPVIGTDPLTFTRINSVIAQTADEITLHLAANQFSIKTTYPGQASISILGTITTGTWNATPVGTAYGGTGATTPAAGLAALGGVAKYTASIGDGATLSYTVTHNLGTRDVTVSVHDNATFGEVETTIVKSTINAITVSFSVAPTANQYRVIVHG
jgi:hypothetical protein